jgi:DNA-binding transcriptional LysR family regulator
MSSAQSAAVTVIPDVFPEITLDALRWFVRVAEAGSISRAARRANVAQSTVSRALARLEKSIGLELASRSGRTFRLTDMGLHLLPHAQAALGSVESLQRAAAESKGFASGTVKLSLCTTLGRHVLLPRLSAWIATRAGVRLDVRLEESDVDPRVGGVDLVVRAGRPRDSELSRTSLGDYGHVLVAAPRYLKRRGAPSHPRELETHDTIALRLERVWSTWPFRHGAHEVRVSVAPRVTVTDSGALLDLACAGEGLTVLPDYLALPAFRAKTLVPVLEPWLLPRIPVHAFHAPTRQLPRVVVEALDEIRRAMRLATRTGG